MKDRIPKYPGRVKLTPVEGQANTFDMIRADEPEQEGTPLNKKTLLTDETASLFGLGEDATVGDAFGVLSEAAFVKKVPQYTQVSLGGLAEGSIIQLNENGSPVDFYVARHNYESGLNGEGRTLLVRKQAWGDTRQWGGNNAYATSKVDTFLNGDYKALLDADIQTQISETVFYYTVGNGSLTVTTLSRPVFLLSATEYGLTSVCSNTEGSALPLAKIIGIDNMWTRSASDRASNYVVYVSNIADGKEADSTVNNSKSFQPAFTLPATYGEFYLDSVGSIHTEQVYATTITDIGGEPVWATYGVSVTNTWLEDDANGGYLQMVELEGILATDNPIADIVMGDDVDANELYAKAWSCITRIVTEDDMVTLYANKEAPATAFTMQLKVVR